ncbi:MAG TPA: hypothetical protein VFQ53_18865 [Kofleriaceae bacterium]|nr:hypothetical protein [Kofleriaceae bacterium]
MKMRTLRKLRARVPTRKLREATRNEFDFTDATTEPEPEPAPELVFDRLTGPFGPRGAYYDEET